VLIKNVMENKAAHGIIATQGIMPHENTI
jgi:hypothetical protein